MKSAEWQKIQPKRRALQKAIIEAAELFGSSRDDGWGANSPFTSTAGKLSKANPKWKAARVCDRLHAALLTVKVMHSSVEFARLKRPFRLPAGEIERRKGSSATSFPRLAPEGLEKDEFFRRMDAWDNAGKAPRRSPDSSRVMKVWAGHRIEEIWAIDFFCKTMACAYEDVTEFFSGKISETTTAEGIKFFTFTAFMNSICVDLCQATNLSEMARNAFEKIDVSTFDHSSRNLADFPRQRWDSIVALAMSERPNL
jgi:hypothetical protein